MLPFPTIFRMAEAGAIANHLLPHLLLLGRGRINFLLERGGYCDEERGQVQRLDG